MTSAEESAWSVIASHFDGGNRTPLVQHQIQSFEDFMHVKIAEIIQGFNPFKLGYHFLPREKRYEVLVTMVIANPILQRPVIAEKDGSTSMMTPGRARLRNFTYWSALFVDIHVQVEYASNEGGIRRSSKVLRNVLLGHIPVMVGSSACILCHPQFAATLQAEECPTDTGGYFIVNGNEKVVISHDRIADNKVFVFPDNKQSSAIVAEIRSMADDRFSPVKLTVLRMSASAGGSSSIRCSINNLRGDLPLVVLFRALGVNTDREICALVRDISPHADTKDLLGSFEETADLGIYDADAAIDMVAGLLSYSAVTKELAGELEHVRNAARALLSTDLFPHTGATLSSKAAFLAYMTGCLLCAHQGVRPVDDRDSYVNKRVDTPGVLMANLFRQYYSKQLKDFRQLLIKDLKDGAGACKTTGDYSHLINEQNISKYLKSSTLEGGLKYGLSTGNWGIKNSTTKQGVAQVLNRLTYLATVSHLRRVNTAMDKSGKIVQPRKLHPHQWGVMCPCETPEGASIGLVKNLSIMALITVSSDPRVVHEALDGLGVVPTVRTASLRAIHPHAATVMVNGDLRGLHAHPATLVADLLRLKRRGVIGVYTAVVWDRLACEVRVSTAAGRMCRPLFIVRADTGDISPCLRDGSVAREIENRRVTFEDLVRGHPCVGDGEPILEYVDVEESTHLMIAVTLAALTEHRGTDAGTGTEVPRYTHAELHPCAILGVTASTIPFPDHNQSPRNCYQSAMGKQAIGIYSRNHLRRLDSVAHVLSYPQSPLVRTRMSDVLHCNDMPCGITCIVAIATYSGYNQEDSVILNRSSVDRGLMASTCYRTYKDYCSKNHSTGEEEIYCRPNEDITRGIKPLNYDKLAPNGFVPVNTFVGDGDILVGKVMPQRQAGGVITFKDNSTVIRGNDGGYVDHICAHGKNFANINADGYNFSKVRTRAMRFPTIGDKMSSRHGQKGTVGMVYAQEDMFFSEDGTVPDLVMNPHAVPSRMTIGQLIECIMGVACTKLAGLADATPFTDMSIDQIGDVLAACGLQRHGLRVMYNPRTGEQMPMSIFIGPTYYQRLKHMVLDKVHSRNKSGPMVMLTRQPQEGRSRDGGLRLGEMEVECTWSHGTQFFLKERFMECSDNYRIFVCARCKKHANVCKDRSVYQCYTCSNTLDFQEIRIPFAMKLLLQEVESMGIVVKFFT